MCMRPDAEIEAISCMEAFASGLVPVIANSAKSATPQFALDERSLFTAGDSGDLTQKIDYWLEHEDERRERKSAMPNMAGSTAWIIVCGRLKRCSSRRSVKTKE